MSRRARLTDAVVARLRARRAEYTVWDTRLPGFGVRVRPSGARSYIYLGPADEVQGRRKRTLGPADLVTVDDARKACLQLQISDLAGASRPGAGAGRIPTFRDFVAREWNPVVRDRYKPTTRQGVDQDVRRQLLPALGPLPLDRITAKDVHRWFDRYSVVVPPAAPTMRSASCGPS